MERRIQLSKLLQENIVLDDKLDESIFATVYEKAYKILGDIDEVNEQYKNSKPEGKFLENRIFNVNNIICFEGRRGTGKTSAMLSFRENLIKEGFEGGKKNKKCFSLDYIDASTLERDEDILDLILANMFKKLIDKDRGICSHQYENREFMNHKSGTLYRLFDEVYSSFRNMRSQTSYMEHVSSLKALTQLSNSQILQDRIKELISLYLEYMYGSDENAYIVIAIDDVDMHFRDQNHSPYEILETIRRYLMIPGVIILITYSFPQLSLACEKYFSNIFSERYGDLVDNNQVCFVNNTHLIQKDYPIYPLEYIQKKSVDNSWFFQNNNVAIKNVKRATMEYLNKVIPSSCRVHMPSWMKKDYDNEIKIIISKKNDEKYFENIKNVFCMDQMKEEYAVDTKKLVFLLKAFYADIFYDSQGEKRHYAQATNLRELTYIVKNCIRLGEQQTSDLKGIDKKYKDLFDDLYFRVLEERLDENEKVSFKEYLQVAIKRRSHNILTDVRKHEIARSKIRYVGSANQSYSYGELVYGLFKVSETGDFSKAMIACIIDSYTTSLTKLYKKMQLAADDEEKRSYKEKIKKVMGSSVFSSCSNCYVPRVGAISANKDLRKPPNFGETIEMGAVKIGNKNSIWKYTLKDDVSDENLRRTLQTIEILGMFFTSVRHGKSAIEKKPGFKISYEVTEENKVCAGSPQEKFFRFIYKDCCFNIMNFVNNSFCMKEYFETLHQNLKPAYIDYLKGIDSSKDEKYYKQTVDKLFEKDSLSSKYAAWYDDTLGFVMPIYSFDIMYNILKRICKEGFSDEGLWVPVELDKEGADVEKDMEALTNPVKNNDLRDGDQVETPKISWDEYWNFIKTLYSEVEKKLKEQDEYYYPNVKMGDESAKKLFEYKYKKSPFIDYINSLDIESSEKGFFEEHLFELFRDIYLAAK